MLRRMGNQYTQESGLQALKLRLESWMSPGDDCGAIASLDMSISP